MIRKNLTDTRQNLDVGSTLGNMLKIPCYTQRPTPSMLTIAKKATVNYNKEHN